jgi:homoserine dehydrogenase
VAGAVPVIRGLSGLLRADEIVKIEGVLNGTTTFVLSFIEETGATIGEALGQARGLGLCEADLSRDLDGSDAADKLAVLAQYLFWRGGVLQGRAPSGHRRAGPRRHRARRRSTGRHHHAPT